MRNLTIALTILVTALLTVSEPALAQAPDRGPEYLVGYKYLKINYDFTHDTHPGDAFLPDSGVPGSAGKTELGVLHFALLGVRYQVPLGKSVSINLDAGALIGFNREEKQNANDSRPSANGAFVYSQANYGFLAAVGSSYHIRRFYAGAEAQVAVVYVGSGWDRFGKNERDDYSFKTVPSVGPKIGYQITDHTSVEASVQFGEEVNFGTQLSIKF